MTATILDYTASLFSLALAAVATLGQLKANNKVSRSYQFAAEILAAFIKRILFTRLKDPDEELIALSSTIQEGTEGLMQTTYSWMYTMQDKDPSWT